MKGNNEKEKRVGTKRRLVLGDVNTKVVGRVREHKTVCDFSIYYLNRTVSIIIKLHLVIRTVS